MTCSDRTAILKWTGPWWTPESSTPRYHQHSGDSRKSPGVGHLDPPLGGANLARREIAVAFDELGNRVPDIEVAAEPEMLHSPFVHGINRLPFEWTQPA